MTTSQSANRTIVIRDRRKPNQYTTDNVVAREWLPILRVGDAFFFYSVYLSMANRDTESSWSSLRTLAKYLQCSVDLIIRANRLLEICELIYIETGNQCTSNEYYILDPPSLTRELQARIQQRLEQIAEQESSQNWHSWVKQVRKALSQHRSLPSIWAEKRARRRGRIRGDRSSPPPQAVLPQNGGCESQAGLAADDGSATQKGGCEPQPGQLCPTTSELVTHMQGARESQAEQDKPTRNDQQEENKLSESLRLLARQRCTHLGVSPPVIEILLENYPCEQLLQQLEWLPFRNARDPAAMLVSAVQGRWEQPAQYEPQRAQEIWASWSVSSEAASGPDGQPKEQRPALVLPGSHLDAGEVWARVLEELRLQMTRATFDTWLGGSQVVGVDEQGLCVRVRDSYAVEWLHARWSEPIQRTLGGIVGCPLTVRFEAYDGD